MTRFLLLAILGLAVSPTASSSAPFAQELCPTTCTPTTSTTTWTGSGWSVTISSVLVVGHGTLTYCASCNQPCRAVVIADFSGWSWDKWQWETPTDSGTGSGNYSHTARLTTDCDATPGYFEGFDAGAGGTWTPGVLVDLYCACPPQ